MNDWYWMQQAYEQASLALMHGEVPIGAVLVDHQGQLLAAAGNAVETQADPAGHAEVLVIRQAAKKMNNHRLLNTTLYVTLEPCCMCAGLIIHARIKRLVFATRDFKAGAAGSVYNLLHGFPLNHQVQIDEGIMQQECAQLLTQFFQKRR
ncbi:MAG: tRNA-specific adenosine deaminase [Legionella sp. 40-6]|nr:tRNA adenosine(34) deaminase TadA [Legionella sp.]OJY18146.1 MAG: tRNA-specific adenosine deaminase [Legionella sp. 40-6]